MHYLFIVDTDTYAGNFERQMTAYMTGVVGECGVGRDQAAIFKQEQKEDEIEEDLIVQIPDDKGCCRPCEIWWDSMKGDGESFAIYMDREPSEEEFDILKRRAFAYQKYVEMADEKEYLSAPNKILRFRLSKEVTTCTELKKWEL